MQNAAWQNAACFFWRSYIFRFSACPIFTFHPVENANCSMTKCRMFFLTRLHFSIFGLSDLHFSPYQIVDLATLCLSRLVRYSLFTTSKMQHAAWLMLFDPVTFFDFRHIRSSLFTMSNCWLGYTVPFSARPIFTFHHVKMQNAA